jgi:hypothetical protein
MNTNIPDRSDAKAFRMYAAKVMQSDGPWEISYRGRDQWEDCDGEPVWSWCGYDYRIAPEPPREQYQPYTFTTAPMHIKARLKSESTIDVAHLTGIGSHQGFWFDGALYSFARALEELEQLDGSPLGMEVRAESEWPKWFHQDRKYIWRMDGPEEGQYFEEGIKQKSYITVQQFENNPERYTRITAEEAAELLAGKGGAK